MRPAQVEPNRVTENQSANNKLALVVAYALERASLPAYRELGATGAHDGLKGFEGCPDTFVAGHAAFGN